MVRPTRVAFGAKPRCSKARFKLDSNTKPLFETPTSTPTTLACAEAPHQWAIDALRLAFVTKTYQSHAQQLPPLPSPTVDPVVPRAATLREIRAISLVESPVPRHVSDAPLVAAQPVCSLNRAAAPQVTLSVATISAGKPMSRFSILLTELVALKNKNLQKRSDTTRMAREAIECKRVQYASDRPPPYEDLQNCRSVLTPSTLIVG